MSADKKAAVERAPLATDGDCCWCCNRVGSRVASSGGRPESSDRLVAELWRPERAFRGAEAEGRADESEPNAAAVAAA